MWELLVLSILNAGEMQLWAISVSLRGYVKELYQFYLSTTKEELASAVDVLQEMTPQPMLSMFGKQHKEAAVQKWSERKRMVTKEVPPTVENKLLRIHFFSAQVKF